MSESTKRPEWAATFGETAEGVSPELRGWIDRRRMMNGASGPVTHWFLPGGGTKPIYSTIEDLKAVQVPPWLVAGVGIEADDGAGNKTRLRVIEVSSEMCLVDPPRHAIETDKIVRFWRCVPTESQP